MNKSLQKLIDSNPEVGSLVQYMIASESANETTTTQYINKFEVVKDILDKLKIDYGSLDYDDYEELCPILMSAILAQSTMIEKQNLEDFDNDIVFIDLNSLIPEESAEIDAVFAKFDYVKNQDIQELRSNFMYRSTFSSMPRLDRLVLCKILIDISIERDFEPLPIWVKYLDTNGI